MARTLIDDEADGGGGRVPAAPAGFSEAYARHYDPLIRLAYVTTGSLSAAEDVVQDAFIELYRRWAEVVEPGAWLRRVVANRCTSLLRRRPVARRYALRVGRPAEPGPSAANDSGVRDALRRLRPRQRAAVFLSGE